MVLFACTNDAITIIDVVKRVLNFVQIALIILLIIYCTLDVAKIVISKSDDEIKKIIENNGYGVVTITEK